MSAVPPESASDELQEVYDRIAGARGGVVGNVFQALGANPGTLDTVARLGAHFRQSGVLDPLVKELLVLAVATELRCAYEWAHHWRAIVRLGIEPDDVAGHLDGSSSATIGPVLAVARALATHRSPDPLDVDAVRSAHGDDGLVEVVVMAGYYVLLASVIDTFAVQVEPWASAPPLPGPPVP